MASGPILYIEDDTDVRNMMSELLVLQGYTVVPLANAEDAVRELDARHYPVVLTDYNLPRHNADWLLRSAAGRGSLDNTTVIVLSAAMNPAGVEGHQLLLKPVDFDELFTALDRALSQAANAAPAPSDSKAPVLLTLYVSRGTTQSRNAIRNLRQVLEGFDESLIELVVRDVTPDATETLADDRVVATPTLVRTRPLPRLWMLGDLSKTELVEQVIRASLHELDVHLSDSASGDCPARQSDRSD